jgi:hypothetical protein
VDTPPDAWNEIVESALRAEVGGELPPDFARRVVRRVELADLERQEAWGWLWWAGMSVIALTALVCHAMFASAEYRSLFSTGFQIAARFRPDLVIALFATGAMCEVAARTIERVRSGRRLLDQAPGSDSKTS